MPKQKLQEDMKVAFAELKTVDHENELCKEDLQSAMEAYDKEYFNFTIDDIEALTDVRIERNKRNGRKQDLHLRIARSTRDILHNNWREGNGRPSAENTVRAWRTEHPEGTKAECHRGTGLDPKTIRKWWG